jgi:hypothetical protein
VRGRHAVVVLRSLGGVIGHCQRADIRRSFRGGPDAEEAHIFKRNKRTGSGDGVFDGVDYESVAGGQDQRQHQQAKPSASSAFPEQQQPATTIAGKKYLLPLANGMTTSKTGLLNVSLMNRNKAVSND